MNEKANVRLRYPPKVHRVAHKEPRFRRHPLNTPDVPPCTFNVAGENVVQREAADGFPPLPSSPDAHAPDPRDVGQTPTFKTPTFETIKPDVETQMQRRLVALMRERDEWKTRALHEIFEASPDD